MNGAGVGWGTKKENGKKYVSLIWSPILQAKKGKKSGMIKPKHNNNDKASILLQIS